MYGQTTDEMTMIQHWHFVYRPVAVGRLIVYCNDAMAK